MEIVFTGSATRHGAGFSRANWVELAQQHNLRVATAVNRTTHYLVASRANTRKGSAARALGVPVMDYSYFEELLTLLREGGHALGAGQTTRPIQTRQEQERLRELRANLPTYLNYFRRRVMALNADMTRVTTDEAMVEHTAANITISQVVRAAFDAQRLRDTASAFQDRNEVQRPGRATPRDGVSRRPAPKSAAVMAPPEPLPSLLGPPKRRLMLDD